MTLCNFKKFEITAILQQIKLQINYIFEKKNYTDRPLVFKCYFLFRLLERSTYLGRNYCQFLLVLGFCVSRLMRSQHLDDVWGELKSYIKVNLQSIHLVTVIINCCNYVLLLVPFQN